MLAGNVAVTAAQSVFKPDPLNKLCWTQTADATVPNLTVANAMRIRVTYGSAAAVDVGHVCTGASPFTCTVTDSIPMALQVPGNSLNVTIQGANVDPVDGSVTPFSTLVSGTLSFSPVIQPPTPGSGSNLRIIKIALAALGAVAGVAIALWHFLT